MVLRTRRGRGFTLVELLIVLGIILVLATLLIPIVSRVQQSAKAAATSAEIAALQGAIEQYYSTFHAYPGPIPNANVSDPNFITGSFATAPQAVTTATTTAIFATAIDSTRITMAENMTLGLLGGLLMDSTGKVFYDPAQVGLGPMNLNSANPKRYPPFMSTPNLSWQASASNLQTGHFFDQLGDANDTIIPEFVDKFTNPMPILYLRCRLGVPTPATPYTSSSNPIITDGTGTRSGPYDISQIIPYTGSYTGSYDRKTEKSSLVLDTTADPTAVTGTSIGVGKSASAYYYNSGTADTSASVKVPSHGLRTVNIAALMSPPGAGYYYPYDAYAYFQNPSAPGSPRAKDGYILISAGKDRVYGTEDDLTSFGSVVP